MYCGDDVSSTVFDIGRYQVRVGYSGEDVPRCVLPAHVGVVADGNGNSEDAVIQDESKEQEQDKAQ